MAYTKGQWLLENSGLTSFPFSIETNDNSTEIARVGENDDALLISKAPEMYEALVMAQKGIEKMIGWEDLNNHIKSLLKEIAK